jgi:hypothetical protein
VVRSNRRCRHAWSLPYNFPACRPPPARRAFFFVAPNITTRAFVPTLPDSSRQKHTVVVGGNLSGDRAGYGCALSQKLMPRVLACLSDQVLVDLADYITHGARANAIKGRVSK